MPPSKPHRNATPIDIDSIVRTVLDRLGRTACEVALRMESLRGVVSVSTVAEIPQGVRSIYLDAASVVTPAATDELRRRGIQWTREPSMQPMPPARSPRLADELQPNSADQPAIWLTSDQDWDDARVALECQLNRRHITTGSSADIQIHLTNSPAAAVIRLIRQGRSTVMISRIADVTRFIQEATPSVFVLDGDHLNLIEMTNCAALIARQTCLPHFISNTSMHRSHA